MLIDTHSHIYSEEFDADRNEAIGRAKLAGVSHIVLPNIDASSIDRLASLSRSDSEYFYVANGLHPTSVNVDYRKELELIFSDNTFASLTNVVAIGEIGMDLYWDDTFVEEQKHVLDFQLSYAKERKLPVIIHCRNAFGQIMDVMSAGYRSGMTGVFHCFSEDYEAAKQVLDMGFNIGVGGVLTYKKSTLPDVVARIPLTSILLETDSPYLAPVPHRGKRNEPAFVACVAEKLSQIIGRDYDDVCETTSANAKKLFNLN
ncbi:MAG: TatD family hydrolase [Bacteroidales bacterium]|nr:TatD family hydrolase [Bacteroidales bacterium]